MRNCRETSLALLNSPLAQVLAKKCRQVLEWLLTPFHSVPVLAMIQVETLALPAHACCWCLFQRYRTVTTMRFVNLVHWGLRF